MPVIVVGEERNFAALRSRLFAGAVSNKTAGKVSDALAEANPHVDLKALTPGTVLTVPDDLPHVALPSDVSLDDRSDRAVKDVLDAGVRVVGHLKDLADRVGERGSADRADLAQALDADEIRHAARADAAIGEHVKALRASLDRASDDDEARRKALAEAEEVWRDDLEALRKLLPLGTES